MQYLIDSANPEEIDQALAWGAYGITANPTMYCTQHVQLMDFLQKYSNQAQTFLSGEVVGDSVQEMVAQAEQILQLDPKIVIKINFSPEGLEVCHILHNRGYRCAMTLIFSVAQAVAAINAGADYVFPFVGRTDAFNGGDGLQMVAAVQQITARRGVSVVAASIKSIYQLEALAKIGVPYAAIPFGLYKQSLSHPLTTSGLEQFAQDWMKGQQLA